MRSPRLLTFALVRDPRLPHLLQGLFRDLWQPGPPRRRLVVAGSYEEIAGCDRADEVEAVLVEVSGPRDLVRLAGAREAAPTARLVAIPSSLLRTPLAQDADELVALIEGRAELLRSLDEDGLLVALAEDGARNAG